MNRFAGLGKAARLAVYSTSVSNCLVIMLCIVNCQLNQLEFLRLAVKIYSEDLKSLVIIFTNNLPAKLRSQCLEHLGQLTLCGALTVINTDGVRLESHFTY